MLLRFTGKGYNLVFPSWHPMDRWDSGIAPDVIGPGFVGNLDHVMLLNYVKWFLEIQEILHCVPCTYQEHVPTTPIEAFDCFAFSCATIDSYGVTLQGSGRVVFSMVAKPGYP